MKVLIADDHQLFLDGLGALLSQQDIVSEVVAVTSLAAMRMALDSSIQLVVTDLRMPGMKGVKHITDLMRQHANTPFVIMSATESQADVDQLMQAGAMAFISKTTDSSHIMEKISLVMKGERYHPELSPLTDQSPGGNFKCEVAAYSSMSGRQFEVLRALADGHGNQAIAAELGISQNTVKTHLRKLFRLFDANTRVEVVMKAKSMGLV